MPEKALLVFGMTRAALAAERTPPIAQAAELLEAVAGEIAYFRERRRQVAFLVPGPEGQSEAQLLQQLHPDLGADTLDAVFAQPTLSAFHAGGLAAWLRDHEIESVTLVGLRSHVEVLYTAAGAAMRGMQIVVPALCVGSDSPEDHLFALRQLRQVICAPLESGEERGSA